MKHVSSEIDRKIQALAPCPRSGFCHRCGKRKHAYEGLVADAGQFFEEVSAQSAMQAGADVIARAELATGKDCITVSMRKKRLAYVGGNIHAKTPGQTTFTFTEIKSNQISNKAKSNQNQTKINKHQTKIKPNSTKINQNQTNINENQRKSN